MCTSQILLELMMVMLSSILQFCYKNKCYCTNVNKCCPLSLHNIMYWLLNEHDHDFIRVQGFYNDMSFKKSLILSIGIFNLSKNDVQTGHHHNPSHRM